MLRTADGRVAVSDTWAVHDWKLLTDEWLCYVVHMVRLAPVHIKGLTFASFLHPSARKAWSGRNEKREGATAQRNIFFPGKKQLNIDCVLDPSFRIDDVGEES